MPRILNKEFVIIGADISLFLQHEMNQAYTFYYSVLQYVLNWTEYYKRDIYLLWQIQVEVPQFLWSLDQRKFQITL